MQERILLDFETPEGKALPSVTADRRDRLDALSNATSASTSTMHSEVSGTRLRGRLLQTILPVVLLPLMAASAVGYHIIAQRTESRIQQQLVDQSLLASEGTTVVLEELLDLPRSIADSPLVVNEAKAGSLQVTESGLENLAIDVLEADFAESKLLRQHNALNGYLKKVVETAEISEISVTDSHGFNVAYSHPTTDFVQSDEAWWQNGKANEQWIGPPDFDFASKGFTVELAQAIRDPLDDSFVGVIRAILPTRKFSVMADYLKRTGISGSQRVQLIDGDTLKTIDTFSPQGFNKDRDIIGDQLVKQVITAFVEATKEENSAAQVLAALKSKTEVDKISLPIFDESAKLASFTAENRQYKVAKIPNSNWVAIASMETSEIAASGRDSLQFFGLFTLLLGGLTTGLIFWLSRQLSSPLARLTQQAQGLAAGNFDLEVEPTGTVETKFLTQTFNQLTHKVKDLLSDQRTETRKAQIFAYITGAPVRTLADVEPLIDETLQSALEILKVDRLAFCQVDAEATTVANAVANTDGRIVVRSQISDLDLPVNHFSAADWLPAHRSFLGRSSDSSLSDSSLSDSSLSDSSLSDSSFPVQEADPSTERAIVLNDIAAADVDDRHREFLKAMAVQSSLSVPLFRTVETNEPEIWGYLIAHHCREPHVWRPDEIGFVQQLAAQLKLVVDRITATDSVMRSRSEVQDSRLAVQQSQQQAETLARQQQQQSIAYRREEESLQQQIATLAREIEGVSQGDLTVRAQMSDGKLKSVINVFNATVAKLEDLVTQIKYATGQVDTVFAQNEQAAAKLIEVAHQQMQESAKTLETVKVAYESMDSVVNIAQEASKGARRVAEKAEAGEAAIQQTSEKIQSLNQTANQAVTHIGQLVRSAHNVSYMTAMISDIAAEMKLLSSQYSYDEGQASGVTDRTQDLSQAMATMAKLSERAVSEAGIIETFLTSAQQTSEQIARAMAQINQQVTDSNQSVLSSQQNLSEVLSISRQFEHIAQSVAAAAQTQPQVTQTATNLIEAAVSLSAQTTQVSEEIAESLEKAIGTTRKLRNSVSAFKVSS